HQHLDVGRCVPQGPHRLHDERHATGIQDRALEVARETDAARDAVRRVDEDQMVVDREETPAPKDRDEAEHGGEDQHRQERPLLEGAADRGHPAVARCGAGRPGGSVPVSSRVWYMRTYSWAITRWEKLRSACARHA